MTSFDAEVVVRRTRYVSDGTGWAVLDAVADDGSPVVLVGPLVHLEERDRAHVAGTWVDDSRYGRQVKVSQARPLPPSDAQTLIAYLRRVKHVGAKRAVALIERHGAGSVLDAIDRDPEAAFAAAGLKRHRAKEAAASWAALRVLRQLHLLLAPHGLGYLVSRVHDEYGPTARRVVSERPYELTSVFGVGFLIADRIARATGTPRATDPAPSTSAPDATGPRAGGTKAHDGGTGSRSWVLDGADRVRAGVLHLLAEAERGGSTCMPLGKLLPDLRALLTVTVAEAVIDDLVRARDLVREGEWIYRAQTAELEAELAHRVADLATGPPGGRLRKPASAAAAAGGPELTAEQRRGVRNAFAHRLSLITGGPGTGKTASIRTIGVLAVSQGARVLLAAPTGRAAVRMSEASGMRAKTVHSALDWIPGEEPARDEQHPLACDLLIVDESSMANLELLVTLLRAVGAKTHVVLVGDADQLAPVGAGKPFADLVGTDALPTTRLTHIFRQAADSMIVQGAHAIRRGAAPDFTASAQMRRDLFLIERPDPVAAREEIASLVSERLPAHYAIDPVRDIQVFAPVYRGELGIDALNDALRQVLNPDGQRVRGGRLRIGDKLMMTGRNLHDLGLMNGTVLRLLDEVSGSEAGSGKRLDDDALILGSEETVFRLPPEQSDRLRLAYACSVHRGQGIELPVAVIVAHPAGGAFFLRREMLYTAVTRAKLATVIVGTREVIARAAATPDTGRRHSRLGERLVGRW